MVFVQQLVKTALVEIGLYRRVAFIGRPLNKIGRRNIGLVAVIQTDRRNVLQPVATDDGCGCSVVGLQFTANKNGSK
jgi:hypothetical protein